MLTLIDDDRVFVKMLDFWECIEDKFVERFFVVVGKVHGNVIVIVVRLLDLL